LNGGMLMNSRHRAEASFTCQDGLAKYLATKHNKRISIGVLTGIIAGFISTASLYIYQHSNGNTSANENIVTLLPLFIGTISGAGYGVISSTQNDANDTADFDAVCESLEAEEESKEEDESDGED